MLQLVVSWKNFGFFVARRAKRKTINGIHLQIALMVSLKKILINLQCRGKITDYWLKYKIFAFQEKKYVTIASALWNMKTFLKQHRLQIKSCH